MILASCYDYFYEIIVVDQFQQSVSQDMIYLKSLDTSLNLEEELRGILNGSRKRASLQHSACQTHGTMV